MKTRLSSKYLETKITFFIPEESISNNDFIDSIQNFVHNNYPHVDRYYYNLIDEINNLHFTGNMLNYNNNEEVYQTKNLNRNMNYINLNGNLLIIYLILKNDLLEEIFQKIIEDFYNIDSVMNNHDYNKLIKRYKANDNSIYCPLLMDYIKKGNMVAETKCGHKFSSNQLRKWLVNNPNNTLCPICRYDLYRDF